MLNIRAYERTEAIEELLDDYDLHIARLEAESALKRLRIQVAEAKLATRKPPHLRVVLYLRIVKLKKGIHLNDLRQLTYRHYQDALRERLKHSSQ